MASNRVSVSVYRTCIDNTITSAFFVRCMLLCLIISGIFTIEASGRDTSETPSKSDEIKIEHLSDSVGQFFGLLRHSALGKRLLDPDNMLGYVMGTTTEKKMEQRVKSMASTLSQLVKSVKNDGWKNTLSPLKDKIVDQTCDFVSSSMQIANAANPQMMVLSNANNDNGRRRDPRAFADLFL